MYSLAWRNNVRESTTITCCASTTLKCLAGRWRRLFSLLLLFILHCPTTSSLVGRWWGAVFVLFVEGGGVRGSRRQRCRFTTTGTTTSNDRWNDNLSYFTNFSSSIMVSSTSIVTCAAAIAEVGTHHITAFAFTPFFFHRRGRQCDNMSFLKILFLALRNNTFDVTQTN